MKTPKTPVNAKIVPAFILLFFLILRTHAQELRRDTLIVHFPYDRYDTILEPLQLPMISNAVLDSILIVGHTDLHGTYAYNQSLSLKRAAWLRDRLSQIPAIRIAGKGKTMPVSRLSRSNRRAVLVFFSHTDSAAALRAPIPAPQPARDSSRIDTVITLRHIYFIENTYVLTDASRDSLPSLFTALKRYRNRNMIIRGYVNSPGDILGKNDHLFILSTKRAQTIYMAMIEAGFNPQRISYEGMGNSVMIVPHPVTIGEMRQNMRVEIEIAKEQP